MKCRRFPGWRGHSARRCNGSTTGLALAQGTTSHSSAPPEKALQRLLMGHTSGAPFAHAWLAATASDLGRIGCQSAVRATSSHTDQPNLYGPSLDQPRAQQPLIRAALRAAARGESTTLRFSVRRKPEVHRQRERLQRWARSRGSGALLAEPGRHEPCRLDVPHRGMTGCFMQLLCEDAVAGELFCWLARERFQVSAGE